MVTPSGPRRHPLALTDRHSERGVLDAVLNAVRAGDSRALVVRGDPGVGKTALLDYLAQRAAGCRVVRVLGMQSEMELAFAGLHQLCAPMLHRLGRLPVPQRSALRTAFGLSAGPAPDRFLVGLAVLSLLADVAGTRPLICLIDDEQWLDRASAQALGFAARRLAADPVGLVFAARVPGPDLAGLPELEVRGLREGDARVLLDSVLAGPLDVRVRDLIVAETEGSSASARVDLLQGQLAFASGLGSDAPPLLLKAAKRLEPQQPDLARETYLNAWLAAMFAGRLAGAGDLAEVSRAARALPRPAYPARLADLLLDGLARLVTDGPADAAATLRQAASAFAQGEISAEDDLRWGWLAQAAAIVLWDEDCWHAIAVQQTQLARAVGALDQLPIDLASQAATVIRSGDFAAAATLIAEAEVVAEATGTRYPPFAPLWLACLSAREAEAARLIEATIAEGTAGGQGHAVSFAHCVAAILYNSLGRYPDALAAAQQASDHTRELYVATWALPELIEAAVRSGNHQIAAAALDRLAEATQARRHRLRAGHRGARPGAAKRRCGRR